MDIGHNVTRIKTLEALATAKSMNEVLQASCDRLTQECNKRIESHQEFHSTGRLQQYHSNNAHLVQQLPVIETIVQPNINPRSQARLKPSTSSMQDKQQHPYDKYQKPEYHKPEYQKPELNTEFAKRADQIMRNIARTSSEISELLRQP